MREKHASPCLQGALVLNACVSVVTYVAITGSSSFRPLAHGQKEVGKNACLHATPLCALCYTVLYYTLFEVMLYIPHFSIGQPLQYLKCFALNVVPSLMHYRLHPSSEILLCLFPMVLLTLILKLSNIIYFSESRSCLRIVLNTYMTSYKTCLLISGSF